MSLSVCTIGHGRADHLTHVLEGLKRQTVPPEEFLIAVMQPDPYVLPDADFPIRQIMVDGGALALAKARNAAAAAAKGSGLAFLDIDCIPSPTFIEDYGRHLAATSGLIMGEVMYLPSGATDAGVDFSTFAECAVLHSERAGPPVGDLAECEDYRCFWSLNFAIRRADFLSVGGFDEGYVGYGGEDTDFGRVVKASGLAIHWCSGGRAYHQYHPHHMPPVHHIDSVISNAITFYKKWGHFTMDHWLHCFELMGLVRMRDGKPVRIREVTADDLALTRQQSHEPYASATTVMELLSGRPAIACR